jgi:hypothetical protein
VRGTLVSSDRPVRVRDISFGGCQVESEALLAVGSLQQVHLETMDGSIRVTITGRIVHSRREPSRGAVFVAGVRFLGPRTGDDIAQFNRLMDAATAVLSFE